MIDTLIELHRRLYRDDIDFNPTQRRPPVAYTYDRTERAMVPDDSPLVINPFTPEQIEVPDSATQSTQVGMPMSARMLRYLQGPNPNDTPWSSSLKAMRAWCRREHPYHRAADRPYWRGSLCWQLVFLTVVGRPKGDGPASLHEAARILRYDHPEPVLRAALQWIEDCMDRQRDRAERRAREDEGHGPGAVPAPSYEPRHDMGGLHAAECPKCRRAA